MNNTKWLEAGDSHIYMVKDDNIGKLPEWRPVGLITLRQIYDKTSPMYYAWNLQPHDPYFFLGKFLLLEGAKIAVEGLELV